MFEGEVQTAGIQMEFVLTESFKKLKVDWVKIDPSRVLQVSYRLLRQLLYSHATGLDQPHDKCHQVHNY